jgi:alpha-tubulin suppressor-like RCC1 family protein
LDKHRISKISAGSYHSLLLSENGLVFSFGKNDYGQLGLGHLDTVSTPTLIKQLELYTVLSISAGGAHSVVCDLEGKVYTFGRGTHGQLGLNSTDSFTTPQLVESISSRRVVNVSAGAWHTLAFAKDAHRTVYMWGVKTISVPMEIPELYNLEVTDMDSYGSLAILIGDGLAYTKDFAFERDWISPPELRVHRLKSVRCGANFFAVLLENGLVLTKGDNKYGQLGHCFRAICDSKFRPNLEFQTVEAVSSRKILQIACGNSHMIAIDGRIICLDIIC